MNLTLRLLLSVLLLIVHYLLFPVPLAEGFLVYIILFNPPWFRRYLEWQAQNGSFPSKPRKSHSQSVTDTGTQEKTAIHHSE